MAKVPFRREIEDLFASDKSVVLKLLAGAFVGGVLSLRVVFKDPKGGSPAFSTPVKITIVVGAALFGMLAVLLLLLRDVVVRRVEQGRSVNPLLRAYFGKGNGCLMVVLWFVTVIFVTFLVTMLTVNLQYSEAQAGFLIHCYSRATLIPEKQAVFMLVVC
jgi:hypothetical protein